MKRLAILMVIIALTAFNSMAFAQEKEEMPPDEIYGPVVGEDIEVGEGEFKIISYDGDAEAVVGDDISIGDDEAKIISIGEDEQDNKENGWLWPTVGGTGALFLAAGAVLVTKSKK